MKSRERNFDGEGARATMSDFTAAYILLYTNIPPMQSTITLYYLQIVTSAAADQLRYATLIFARSVYT
jgi:hypothetical protein